LSSFDRSRDDGPTIKPKAPDDRRVSPFLRPPNPAGPGPGRPLIPIEGATSTPVRSGAHADPYAFWMQFYRTHDDPAKLRETVRLLNLSGKTRDVHAALLGFLTNHSRQAQAWMYEALAVAIEMNQGSPADVKTALNYAADLAQRSHNPNDLVSVADKLLLRDSFERIGPLLDEAAAKVPHRAEPLFMSIILAQKTRDPRRMADSIDRLLALGWPGQDDYMRTESRNQAGILARSLREAGRGAEADKLLAALTNSEARDVFIRLTWDGDADFDLAVEGPVGFTASYQTPRTVCGGAIVKNGYGSHPEEVYVCPRGFDGDYKARITTIYTDPSKPVTGLTLEMIVHEGTSQERKQTVQLLPDKLDQPVTVHLSGGRRKQLLPYVDPATVIAEAQAQLRKNLKTRPGLRNRPDRRPPAAPPPPRTAPKDAAQRQP
jgi:hypothetical protein